jgi:hypothetical protein
MASPKGLGGTLTPQVSSPRPTAWEVLMATVPWPDLQIWVKLPPRERNSAGGWACIILMIRGEAGAGDE